MCPLTCDDDHNGTFIVLFDRKIRDEFLEVGTERNLAFVRVQLGVVDEYKVRVIRIERGFFRDVTSLFARRVRNSIVIIHKIRLFK